MQIVVQTLNPEQTWDLRHRILRPHQTIQDCIYPLDHADTSFHVGALTNGKVICVASFNVENTAALPAKKSYRLRGMATDPNFQQRGAGRAVIEKSLQELRERNCDLLWFNAREVAFPFYEKLGFKYLGELFEISGIGPHKVMYKFLN